ncbi:MAG: ABC transporter permease [Rhodanobacteraceae bacterium]
MLRHIVKPLLRRPLMPLLVILQVALACAIACNALFLLQQKLAPILAPTGIENPGHLVFLSNLIARGKPWPAARLRQVQADLRSVPGVAAASYAVSLPMVGTSLMQANVYGADKRFKADTMVYFGDNLMKVLKLRLVAGRAFTPEENAVTLGGDMGFHTAGPVIVTRALADRLYPGGHALGKTLHYSDTADGQRTIVGIIAHLPRNRFGRNMRDLDYTILFPGMANQWPLSMFAVRLRGTDVPQVCKKLREVLQRDLGARMLPGNEVECKGYSEMRNGMLAQPRAAVWLFSGVTLIVLIVTLTGIAGMTGYWVQQRTRSIGIRRALGAKRRDVLRELLLENLLVVGAGVIVGLIAAYGINLWLMRHYELLRLPWVYLPIGAALLLVLGQLAVLTPARRASNIPPIVAARAV